MRPKRGTPLRLGPLPIYTEIVWEWEEQSTPQRRAWKKLEDPTIGKTVEEEAAKLGQELGSPSLATDLEVENYLGRLQGGIQRIVESNVPWAKPSSKAKSFWNPACTRATTEAKKRRREYERNPNAETREIRR